VLLMFTMNNVAAGGWRLLWRGVLVCMAGVFAGGAVLGFNMEAFGSMTETLACLPVMVSYPLALGIMSYNSAVKLAERSRQLKALSEHDSLTGLLNRATLAGRLGHAIDRARSTGGRVSVVFIDLDDFKIVNDSLGHGVGDRLLIAVADRLRAQSGDAETVARYGGDEFVIVSTRATLEQVQEYARALVSGMTEPVHVSGHELFVEISVGVSTWPEHGEDAQALLTKADVAMYAAKTGGRNRSATFHLDLHAAAEHRLDLSNRLRRALRGEELSVHYQPQVDMRTGALKGWKPCSAGMIRCTARCRLRFSFRSPRPAA
jgi:diguanylate cyclase (GGDEF)-like protein